MGASDPFRAGGLAPAESRVLIAKSRSLEELAQENQSLEEMAKKSRPLLELAEKNQSLSNGLK